MENKFKEFWINKYDIRHRVFDCVAHTTLEKAEKEKSKAIVEGSIHVIEYAALESANDKIEALGLLLDSANEAGIRITMRKDELKEENKKLAEENAKLRAALEHISSPKHWAIDTFVPEIRDRVKIAREALRESK